MANKNLWTNVKNLFSNNVKAVLPVGNLSSGNETDRGGLYKAMSPDFFFRPPFGVPRNVNLLELRRLAKSPYVDMAINTIIDKITSIDWDIIPEDEEDEISDAQQVKIDHIKAFFDNPNTNQESFENILRKWLRDILELDSGVIVKIFDKTERMVALKNVDGATMLKNPDRFGMITDRAELLTEEEIVGNNKQKIEPFQITTSEARDKAAYFQFGWQHNSKPIPFGKREIVFVERNPRTDRHYGRGPVEILAETIQLLIHSIQHNLEYYTNNNIPKGLIGLTEASAEDVKAFEEMWNRAVMQQDTSGNWHKKFHKVPITNKKPEFTRIQFSNAELELLEQQRWFSKLVWSSFGLNPTELGFTEDAKGMSNQIVQTQLARERVINPLLRLLEYHINHQIIPEFEYEGLKFKFNTFDIESEFRKAELYEKQTGAPWRTVNEIRRDEGLEEVEWGDEPPKEIMGSAGNTFNFGQNQNPEQQNEPQGRQANNEGNQGSNQEAEEKSKKKEKALDTEAPLDLEENEKPNFQDLEKRIKEELRKNEKRLLELIKQESREDKIGNLKGIKDVVDRIKDILSFEGLKDITRRVIEQAFNEGQVEAEKTLDRNIMPNKEALQFIQDYTFDNIKEMTDEVKNDLRQELERGFMNREGIRELSQRVRNVFDKGENRATMIARTETNRAQNQGTLRTLQDSGEKVKKWILITSDERTSEISKALDRKYGSPEKAIPIDQDFVVTVNGKEVRGTAPPFHVNERDKLMFIVEDEDQKPEKNFARNI